jgi:hypothetical protein
VVCFLSDVTVRTERRFDLRLGRLAALRHKTVGPGFDSWCVSRKFSNNPVPLSACSSPRIHPASIRKEYQGTSLGVKCGRRVELTTLQSYLLLLLVVVVVVVVVVLVLLVVVPNIKVRVEAEHSIPVVSLHDLLWESFTFHC